MECFNTKSNVSFAFVGAVHLCKITQLHVAIQLIEKLANYGIAHKYIARRQYYVVVLHHHHSFILLTN